MTDRTVYYWQIYCNTEGALQYVWNTETPTVCPNNDGHTTSGNPTIIDQIDEKSTLIKEEMTPENAVPTNGTYKFHGYTLAIPESGNASVSLNWPFPIVLMNGWFFSEQNQIGDVVHATVAPSTIVGIIVAPIYAGNSVITVNSTVTDNVIPGYFLDLLDTQTFTINDLGQVASIDLANSQITCENVTANTFTDIGNVVVRMSVKVIENMKICCAGQKFDFASKKIGGKYLPPNTDIKIDYWNVEGNAKNFDFNIEYLY